MRVAFAPDVLAEEAGASAWLALVAILSKVQDGWHLWHVDDPESMERSPFLVRNRHLIGALLEEAVKHMAWTSVRRVHSRCVRVSFAAASDAQEPSAAKRLLETPLRVVMENRNTDGAFLNAVLAVLGDPETTRLRECGALVYDSPGGVGELLKLVRSKAAPWTRIMVFADSDARFPGHIGERARVLARACEQAGIPCHILRKREIENYVPDEILRTIAPGRPHGLRDAVLRLTVPQRDHIDMKKGLKDLLAKPKIQPEEKALYAEILGEDLACLQGGFGGDFIFMLYAGGDAELGVPRPELTADGLRHRDGLGELDELVALIEMAL